MTIPGMSSWLDVYPDRAAAEQLCFGFTSGFFILFFYSRNPVFADNLKSARYNLEVLRDKVSKEVILGRMFGPFTSPPFTNFHVSTFGFVPKNEAGKF